MNDDQTQQAPDLCCVHGQKIDRLLELVEDLAAARRKPRRADKPTPDAYLVAEFFTDGVSTGVWTSEKPGVTGPADLERASGHLAMDPPVEITDGCRYYWATREPKFARGGIVKNPTRTSTKRNGCCIPAEGYCPEHDGELITAAQARTVAEATLTKLQRQGRLKP